jgi:glutamyl-tRNA reductase
MDGRNNLTMIQGLVLTQFPPGTAINFPNSNGFFCLNTCQRVIYLDFKFFPLNSLEKQVFAEIYSGSKAYHHLLNIICGLESKILGESEIVHQFKTSFNEYLKQPNRDPRLIKVLEKLFKDAKEIRSKHLINVGQNSYAGITRILLEKKSENKLLIVGNGSMSQSLIKVLKKRFDIYLTGRDPEKVSSLGLPVVPWLNYNAWSNFSLIVNTIGAQTILFDDHFFDSWINNHPNFDSRRFIDLGCPSVLKTRYNSIHGISLLKDVFEKGDILDQAKREKIESAKGAILEIAKKRSVPLTPRVNPKEFLFV